MKKLILGAVSGGVMIFIWGSISWMFLPWHMMTMHSFKDESVISKTVLENILGDGIYMSPCAHKIEKDKASDPEAKSAEERMKEGPIIFTSVRQSGYDGMGRQMVIGFLIQTLASFFVGWLLLQTSGLSYLKRVLFVTIFGLASAIVGHIPYWNWWGFQTQYTLVSCADLVIGWFLAGLVIAPFSRK